MRIQIIGDSNTYGYAPGGGRLMPRERWADLLRGFCEADDVRINGANGRTFLGDGEHLIEAAILADVDLLVVQLGSNDLLQGAGVAVLKERIWAKLTLWCAQCPVIWILPGAVDPLDEGTAFGPAWLVRATKAFSKAMRETPLDHLYLLDSADLSISLFDGLHLEPAGHQVLAKRVAHAIAEVR